MILFNPSWQYLQQNLSTDDLVGQIRSFIDSKYDYQVLISEYMPHLRYFLHRYGLLECHYHSLFDELQGVLEFEQSSISLKDLGFPVGSTFSYTPFNILVHFNNQLVGQICFGRGGETFVISEVQHFYKGKMIKSEVYDDRGFVSSLKMYEEENLKYTDYLDSTGEWIIREFEKDGSCEINVQNSRGLRNNYYKSMSAITFEMMEQHLEKYLEDIEAIIISITNDNMAYIPHSIFISKMVLSFFKERYSFLEKEDLLVEKISKEVKAVISDSSKIFEHLPKNNSNSYLLSPYDSRFKLSYTQEIKEEVLYIDVRELRNDEIISVINSVVTGLLYALYSTEEEKRTFEVIFRVKNKQAEVQLLKITEKYFDQTFSNEMMILKQLIEEEVDENNLKEQHLSELEPKVQMIYQIWRSFIIQEIKTEDEIFELIGKVRLIIDMSFQPDLFTQIAGISAGIPQLNRIPTEYVQHEKNGLILSDLDKLSEAITYYLENLGNWQIARAYSVQQIKRYSGIELQKKILEIIRGDDG